MQKTADLKIQKDGPSVYDKDSYSRLNKNGPKKRLLRAAVLAVST